MRTHILQDNIFTDGIKIFFIYSRWINKYKYKNFCYMSALSLKALKTKIDILRTVFKCQPVTGKYSWSCLYSYNKIYVIN